MSCCQQANYHRVSKPEVSNANISVAVATTAQSSSKRRQTHFLGVLSLTD